MAKGQSPSPGKRVGGVALMLLGVALIGWGTHFLAKNGNCSSTGYVSYGPVPKCGGGEALYIISTFFLGPLLAVAGWMMAQSWGALWPAVCISVGIGLVTLPGGTAGAPSFGLAGGLVFFVLAVLSVVLTARKRLRRKAAPPGLAGPGPARPDSSGRAAAQMVSAPAAHSPVPAGPHPTDPQPAEPSSPDRLDRIAKLAQLRDSGALTSEEFETQKAKLLAGGDPAR
jgi:Short C-terminal domain